MATCDTCRHWRSYRLVGGVMRGDCLSGDARLPAPVLDTSDYRPLLATRADFGCIVHAPIAKTGMPADAAIQAPKIH